LRIRHDSGSGAELEFKVTPPGKENVMTTYVTLYNFTDQGIRNIKDTVKRTEAAKKAASQ
jgi:uncharacterized protein with GYD domain